MQRYMYGKIEVIRFSISPLYKEFVFYLYFFDGILIDTGPRIRKKLLVPLFKELAIEKVYLTHHHDDHMGMAWWLAKHLELDIYANEKTVPYINKRTQIPFPFKWGSNLSGVFPVNIYPVELKHNNYNFIPIYTPGHTDDHVALYEPKKKWLFTGDLYITTSPKVAHATESITQYIQSLEKILVYDFDVIFCAHEGPIENAKAKIIDKITYLKRTQKAVIEFHQAGLSENEIVKIMFPRRVTLESMTFGAFSRKKFIKACLK